MDISLLKGDSVRVSLLRSLATGVARDGSLEESAARAEAAESSGQEIATSLDMHTYS